MIGVIVGLILLASSAWAEATLPTYPTEYTPGYTAPVTSTSKSVCATVNITGASNASPIVITTAGHTWVTGQTVIIASVGGNTAANGTRVITKISATQFSLNGTTGNGAYTSGGTAACDYSNLQTALDTEAPAGDVTLWLNQGETYAGMAANSSFKAGFILPTKSSTNWTVIRTWDDGNLPPQERRIRRQEQPLLAKLTSGVAGGTSVSAAISCAERANYYWLKAIELVRPIPQSEGDGVACLNENGAGWNNPARKWIKNIVDSGGGVVTVEMDAARMQTGASTASHGIPVNVDLIFDCAQCAGIGLTAPFYNVNGVSKRVVNITGATNASPIVVTTAVEQYWITGQQVDIAGVGGNTAANGTARTITRISSTQFSINGTTGNGTYTSGGTVQSRFNDQITISGTLTGSYVFNSADNMQADSTAFPTHIVFEQFWVESPTWSNQAAIRQGYTSGFNLSGEDIVVRQSHIDVCGSSVGEFGRGILVGVDGPRRAVIENNYIAGCMDTIFFDANPIPFNKVPTDITVRGNTLTQRSSMLPNRLDPSSNWYKNNRTVKNIIETKAGVRIRITGNELSRGYSDGQATQIHWTNRHNYGVSNHCGVSTGVEGEGCHTNVTLSDLIVDYNVMKNMGQHCLDIIGQSSGASGGPAPEYASIRTDRVLVTHNLAINCGGYPSSGRYLGVGPGPGTPSGGSFLIMSGGPKNVTITHNTATTPDLFHSQQPPIKQFCNAADNPSNGAMVNTDGVTRTGTWTACTQSAANGSNVSGVSPNLTVTDNILWSSTTNFGAYGFATVGGGSILRCDRTNSFNPGTEVDGSPTGVWHHNLIVGAVGTLSGSICDMNVTPGTQVLATGSQLVSDTASMNYVNLGKHIYKLTPSSPGYHAASDGTDIGVDWDALYRAVNQFQR